MMLKEAKSETLSELKAPNYIARKKQLAELDSDIIFLGNGLYDTTYDPALIGIVQRPCEGYAACYDYDKCVKCLVDSGFDHQDAVEWM